MAGAKADRGYGGTRIPRQPGEVGMLRQREMEKAKRSALRAIWSLS